MKEVMFTHVKQDEEQIGKIGVQMLADAIRGEGIALHGSGSVSDCGSSAL
ncbi:MAG: hypothetical protein ACLTQL_09645 [Eisenbergiella sp.]